MQKKMNRSRIFASAETWISRIQNLWVLFTLPSVAGFLTALLGYIQNLPVMWIAVGGIASFSFMANGVLRFVEWRQKTEVQYKFDVIGIYPLADCAWNKQGKPTKIEKLNIGFQILNRASFPIQYEIEECRVVSSSRIADASKLDGQKFIVPAMVGGGSHPEPIAIGDLNTTETSGHLEVTVKYGKIGNLKYSINKKYAFDLSLNIENSEKPSLAVRFASRDISPSNFTTN